MDGKYLEWAIDNVKYGSAAVLPILQMLYPNLNYGTVSFHIDHIYPKSKFNKKNKELPNDFIGRENELRNLQMLEGSTNEEKNDKDPEEWLNESIPESDKRKEYLNNNYIKEGEILSWSNLSQFATNRKIKLLVKLKQLFNVV